MEENQISYGIVQVNVNGEVFEAEMLVSESGLVSYINIDPSKPIDNSNESVL